MPRSMGLLFMVIFSLGKSEVILLRMVLKVDIEVLGETTRRAVVGIDDLHMCSCSSQPDFRSRASNMIIGMRFELINTFRHRNLYHFWRPLQRRGMSYEASLAKLTSPLKDLVTNAQAEAGKTDGDQVEITGFIDKVAEGDIVKAENMPVSFTLAGVPTVANLLCLIGTGDSADPANLPCGQLLHCC